MYTKKDLLLQSAARLYTLGVDIEEARNELRQLVDAKVPYDSAQMLAALKKFQELNTQWQVLEQQYLNLKSDITQR